MQVVKRIPFLSNVALWMILFATWSLWESAIRIFLFHKSWTILPSVSFTIRNLLCYSSFALVLGLLHSVFLLLSELAGKTAVKIQSTFLPASVALFSLVAIPLLQSRNLWNLPRIPRGGRGVAVALLLMSLFVLCVVFIGSLSQAKIKATAWKKVAAVFILIPLTHIFIIQVLMNLHSSVPQGPKGPMKHVVLISIDTLRYDYVGVYGANQLKTPVIDKIASEGALFEVAISSIPQTGPSHASMFTGESPLSHGVRYNGSQLDRNKVTMTQVMRNAGFQTAGFISGFTLKTINCGLNRGFQQYDDYLALIDFFSETYYGRLLIRFFPRGFFRQAKNVTDKALSWLDHNADTPFFLFLHYFDAHYPYGRKDHVDLFSDPLLIVDGPENVTIEKQLYAGEVQSVDTQIGRVVDFLKSRGIYDNTLLIIVGDHGESLGEHDYYYDHDRYVYEQLIRVPLIIRCPLLVRPGTVKKAQVAVLDIYKTILGAIGLKPANKPEGYDLIRLANNINTGYERRVILSHSFYYKVHGLRSNSWKLIQNPNHVYELYNLSTDPGETHNLYNVQRQRGIEMRETMTKLFHTFRSDPNETITAEDLSPEQLEDLKSLGYFN